MFKLIDKEIKYAQKDRLTGLVVRWEIIKIFKKCILYPMICSEPARIPLNECAW